MKQDWIAVPLPSDRIARTPTEAMDRASEYISKAPNWEIGIYKLMTVVHGRLVFETEDVESER